MIRENHGSYYEPNKFSQFVNFDLVSNKAELPAVVRINSGGPEVTYEDSFFIADQYFSGNVKTYRKYGVSNIFDSNQDEIYLSERSTQSDNQSFSYNIPVTNGEYEINLHFAEIYWGAADGGPGGTGKRIFEVRLEGELIISNFDINAEVEPLTALVKTFTTSVTDQSLDLTFSASVNRPKLSAIEVFGEGNLLSKTEEVFIESLSIINCPTEPIYVGDVIDLDVEVFPTNTTNKAVAYISSDALSVEYTSGVFTASSPGEITVSVTSFSDGSIFDQCTFNILDTVDQEGPSVNSFILVNADTDQDIAEIKEGDVFNLEEIGTSNLNIRAEVEEGTESVVFDYQSNSNYSIENQPVYAIGGYNSNDYNPWTPDIGQNTVSAIAYSGDNGTNLSGSPLTVNFEIIEAATEKRAVVRINSGGSEVSFGESFFTADQYFSGNVKTYTKYGVSDIFDSIQDEIYLSERSTQNDNQTFSYNIPVTNGEYEINLHFAEIYWGTAGGGPGGTGKRIFEVRLEGELIISNFDINAEVEPLTALVKTFTTSVTDQSLDITFSASVNRPKLSAIEVFGEGSLLSETEEVFIESLSIINCPAEPIYVGDVIDLNVEVFPANTTNQIVAFTASDAISVDYLSGAFSASAPGEYTVTVTSFSNGDIFEQCTITVMDTVAQEVPEVTSLFLVNADTDQDIAEIKDGDVFNLEEIGTSNLNIRAEVEEGTESVVFDYQGNSNYRIENQPVYAIGGYNSNDYNPWIPEMGQNTISALAYSGDNGTELSGHPLTLSFEIIEETTELPAVVRINSGGPTAKYGDTFFIADQYFAGNGNTYVQNSISDIFDSNLDEIYKSERSTRSDKQSFTYNIPVTNGEYEIKLHFAEIFWGATGGGPGGSGKRVFDVILEGNVILSDFDINAQVDPMTALVKTFATTVSDQSLDLTFSSSVNRPKLSAIEVFGEGQLSVEPLSCIWNPLQSSSLGKTESQSVKINDKLYVMGGFIDDLVTISDTEIYDPSTDTWSNGAPMPIPVTHMGAVAVGEEIWILAGFAGDHPGVATGVVQIYNTVTDKWTTGPSFPEPRASGGAVFNEGKIHYFGGLLPDRVTDVGDHYVLDVNDQSSGWKTLAPLPIPRNHLGAAAVNGILYAIGGQFGHDYGEKDDQSFVHAYDPKTNQWTEKNNLNSDRSHFEPGTIVHNNKIIIVGGIRETSILNNITEYDPQTDSWRELCQLPTKILAPSAKIINGQLIVANGGENGTCCPINRTISMAITPGINSEALRVQSQEGQVSITPEMSGNNAAESTISTGDLFENTITIFPNPIKDILIVKSSSHDPINITLIAPTGTVLLEKKDVHQFTFDTSTVKPGMYILIVNNGEAYKRFRLFKK